jgi:phosphoadenosine phosphosulfate reductase
VRKIEPLRRALAGKKAWISGLRADPADTGAVPAIREFDAATGLEKFNPLADWSEREIWSYIRTRNLPYNRLHDQHYPVIGCSPCTRPAAAGAATGAKRWWWETPAAHGSYLAKQA